MRDEPSHKGKVSKMEVLTLLLRLRQVCCHPALIATMLDKNDMEQDEDIEEDSDGESIDLLAKISSMKLDDESSEAAAKAKEEDEETKTFFSHDNRIFNTNNISSKMKYIIDEVKKVTESSQKAVVVSQWTSYLNMFSNHFRMMNIRTQRIDGSVPLQMRTQIVEDFNTNPRGPPVSTFVIYT